MGTKKIWQVPFDFAHLGPASLLEVFSSSFIFSYFLSHRSNIIQYSIINIVTRFYFREFVSQLERYRDFTVAPAKIPRCPSGHETVVALPSPRLIYREICPALPRGIPGPGTTSVDALAWIPNNLICRDLSAISCLLGHVWRSIPSLSVCDSRVSYSPSALPPLHPSSFPHRLPRLPLTDRLPGWS